MLWNIFLAWVPTFIIGLGIMLIIAFSNQHAWQIAILCVTLLLWFLSFPNAPYLITELNFSHRRPDEEVPLYFDIMQTLSLTAAGLFVGQFSLILVHVMLIVIFSPGYSAAGQLVVPGLSWGLIMVCIYLAGFAIYLGRNVRVNSWDVIKPWRFIKKLFIHLRQPGETSAAFGYLVFYGTFIAIMHTVFFGIIQLLITPPTLIAG